MPLTKVEIEKEIKRLSVAFEKQIAFLNKEVNVLKQKTTIVSDETLKMHNITKNNVSTIQHGFAPKGDGSTTKFLNANGEYSTPSGSGGSSNGYFPQGW